MSNRISTVVPTLLLLCTLCIRILLQKMLVTLTVTLFENCTCVFPVKSLFDFLKQQKLLQINRNVFYLIFLGNISAIKYFSRHFRMGILEIIDKQILILICTLPSSPPIKYVVVLKYSSEPSKYVLVFPLPSLFLMSSPSFHPVFPTPSIFKQTPEI